MPEWQPVKPEKSRNPEAPGRFLVFSTRLSKFPSPLALSQRERENRPQSVGEPCAAGLSTAELSCSLSLREGQGEGNFLPAAAFAKNEMRL
jgi:hypothetical protein